MRCLRFDLGLLPLVWVLWAGNSWAGDRPPTGLDPSDPTAAPRKTAEERPFAYTVDPSTPSAGRIGLEYGFGLASGVDASRPLPASVVASGAVHGLSTTVGVTDRIAPFVSASFSQPDGTNPGKATGALGARFQLLDPSGPVRLGLVLTGFRELSGALGTSLRVTASWDPTPNLRVAGNVLAEKVFAAARDGIDLLAFVGVSYRVSSSLRLGAEYVGQDLEDAIEEEEAEGGAKHFVGPTASLDLDRGRVQLVIGPAFGLNAASPRLLGRAALLVSF